MPKQAGMMVLVAASHVSQSGSALLALYVVTLEHIAQKLLTWIIQAWCTLSRWKVELQNEAQELGWDHLVENFQIVFIILLGCATDDVVQWFNHPFNTSLADLDTDNNKDYECGVKPKHVHVELETDEEGYLILDWDSD